MNKVYLLWWGILQSFPATYITPWVVGQVVTGGGVGVVEQSNCKAFDKGDMVTSFVWPWQHCATFSGEDPNFQKVDSQLVQEHPSLVFGLLGVTGLTSLLGLKEKAHLHPRNNQTVVVSGAAGACGVAAGQIAKLLGSGPVIGICGTAEKCDYIKESGFDGAINYKETRNLREDLRRNCPKGVDVYFDNVGGGISDDVIRIMNKDSNIVLCGQISQYNKDLPYPPPLPQEIQEIADKQNVTRERFLVLNYHTQFPAALKQLEAWVKEGKLKSRETIEVGLENAGKAFVSMMNGGNIGKQVVKVA